MRLEVKDGGFALGNFAATSTGHIEEPNFRVAHRHVGPMYVTRIGGLLKGRRGTGTK